MENPNHMEWVPTSLCEIPSLSSPKESLTALSEFVVICELIVILWHPTQTMFTGVSHVVPKY